MTEFPLRIPEIAAPVDITVAALIERDNRFLVVEEHAGGRRVINQPAGHVEPGESLLDAVIRETREETGYHFAPQALLGVYHWHSSTDNVTFLRVAFIGEAEAPDDNPALDEVIIATHWLSRDQLLAREPQLRSPLVLRCIEDYRAGTRYPLTCLADGAIEAQLRHASR